MDMRLFGSLQALIYTCIQSQVSLSPSLTLQVRLASVAENAFNAVERISEFCDLPQEAAEEIPDTKPDNWPGKGEVRPCCAPTF